MANTFNISKANPLRGYYQSFELNTSNYTSFQLFDAEYNTRGIDNDFYYNNIPEWISKVKYFNKFQQTDTINLQWCGLQKNAPFVDYKVYILNCKGEIVRQITPSTDSVNPTYLNEYIWEVSIPLYNLNPGKYFVQIKREGFGLPDKYFIFEPFEVKGYHKNTLLLEYTNTSNDYGLFFENTNLSAFKLRLNAFLTEMNTSSKFNVYDSQTMDLQMLGGVAYREYSLEINQVPRYVIDLLERVFLFDTLKIDGIEYTRVEGSKFDITPNKSNFLHNLKIQIREKNNDDKIQVDNLCSFKVAELPNELAFYVENVLIGASINVPVEMYYETKLDFLNALNNYFNDGTVKFYLLENSLYIKALNDTFNDDLLTNGASLSKLLTNYFKFEIDTNSLTHFECSIESASDIDYAFFYNDGSSKSIQNSVGTSETITKTYNKGIFTSYLFYTSVYEFILDSTTAKLSVIGGNLGSELITLSCINNSVYKLSNNLLINSPLLSELYLTDNLLNNIEINKIILFLYEINLQNGGVAELNNQLTGATNTNDAGIILMKSKLNNLGFDIITD